MSWATRTIKDLLPPLATRKILSLVRPPAIAYKGPYQSWADAAGNCETYAAEDVFSHVLAATRAVVGGEAVYARDGFVMPAKEYDWPLLASLLWIAARERRLHVVDFGGSLGSTYRQVRGFLDHVERIRWTVLEQTHFVEAGIAEFQGEELRFAHRIAEVEDLDVVVCSSSLCYIPDPWACLDEFAASGARHLVIDRTPMHDGEADLYYAQFVRPPLYHASYPCRVFAREGLLSKLRDAGWRVVTEWVSDTQPNQHCTYTGFHLERTAITEARKP
jgi:putative methyltransferase (TIGR04325 family)